MNDADANSSNDHAAGWDPPPGVTILPSPGTDMLRTSPTVGKIFGALAKAQGAIHGALKDSTNPHFKSKYADLSACWEACREPLAANGIAVLQPTATNGHMVSVATRLGHESGEWLESPPITMAAGDTRPQSIGSAITYGKRYGLTGMVGIAPEDDDGEAAQGRPNGNGAQQAPAPRSEISRGAEAGLSHLAQNARPSTPAETATQQQAAQSLAARPSNQDRLKAKARELNLPLKAITDVLADKEWPNPARLTEDQVLDMERALLPEYALRTLPPAEPQPEILPDGSRNPEFLIDPEEEEEVA